MSASQRLPLPDRESGEPFGLFLTHVDRFDPRIRRASPGEVDEAFDVVRFTFEDRLDGSLGCVARPAGDAVSLGEPAQ